MKKLEAIDKLNKLKNSIFNRFSFLSQSVYIQKWLNVGIKTKIGIGFVFLSVLISIITLNKGSEKLAQAVTLSFTENFTTDIFKDPASTATWNTGTSEVSISSGFWGGMNGLPGPENVTNINSPSLYNWSFKYDSVGTPYILWDNYNGLNSEVHLSRWNGTAWKSMNSGSDNDFISIPGEDSYWGTIAFDSLNRPYVTWEGYPGGSGEVYFKRWNGSAWVSMLGDTDYDNISNNAGASDTVQVFADANDIPYITWQDNTSGLSDILFTKWNGFEWAKMDGTAGFDTVTNVENSSWRYATAFDVSNLNNVKAYVAWMGWDVGTSSLNILISTAAAAVLGGGWNNLNGDDGSDILTQEFMALSSYAYDPIIQLSSANLPYVIWRNDSPQYEIYITKWIPGTGWTHLDNTTLGAQNVSNTAGVNAAFDHDFKLDQSDNPNIVWADFDAGSANNDIYFTRWNGSNLVDIAGNPGHDNLSNNAGGSTMSRIVIDRSGATPVQYVAWQDDSAGNSEIFFSKGSLAGWTSMDGLSSFDNVSNTAGSTAGLQMRLDANNLPSIIFDDYTLGGDTYFTHKVTPTLPVVAQSLTVDSTLETIENATITATQTLNGQTVNYYLSSNGGSDWCAATLGVEVNFTTCGSGGSNVSGSDLQWKAEMNTSDINISPVISDISIDYYIAVYLVDQTSYRFRNDDGSETTATYAAAENVGLVDFDPATETRLRIRVDGKAANVTVPTRVDELSMNLDSSPVTSTIDTVNGYAYIISRGSPSSTVKKVRISDFTEVDSLILAGAGQYEASAIDVGAGFLYVGGAELIKIRLSDFTIADTMILDLGEDLLISSAMDIANGFAYFAASRNPTVILKINLATFTKDATLSVTEQYLETALFDEVGGAIYFVSYDYPAEVVKVRTSDFTKVGTLTLDPGEGGSYKPASIIDPVNQFMYIGTETQPGKIVKIDISPVGLPVRIGAITMNAGENSFAGAGADLDNRYGYFMGEGFGAAAFGIVKIDLNSFTRVASVNFNPGEAPLYNSFIDADNGYFYAVQNRTPTAVFKYDISVNKLNFRLEYGKKVSTCSAIASWTQVLAVPTTEDWRMFNSTNITDAEVTTHNPGDLNGPNTYFSVGEMKDVTAQTLPLRVDSGYFSELEFSIKPTSLASGAYCFRLTNAGLAGDINYINYPEIALTAPVSGGTRKFFPQNLIINDPYALDANSIRWVFDNTNTNPVSVRLYQTNNSNTLIDTGATTFNAATGLFVDETGLQPNTRYESRFVTAYNGYGESGSDGYYPAVYTLTNPLSAPTYSNQTDNSITLTFGANGNPASTLIAIKDLISRLFVQADGSLGANIAYLPFDSAWNNGVVNVIGLSAGTQYQFALSAQNGDGIVDTVIDGVSSSFDSAKASVIEIGVANQVTLLKGVQVVLGNNSVRGVSVAGLTDKVVMDSDVAATTLKTLENANKLLNILLIVLLALFVFSIITILRSLTEGIAVVPKITLIPKILKKEASEFFGEYSTKYANGSYIYSFNNHKRLHELSRASLFSGVGVLALKVALVMVVALFGADLHRSIAATYCFENCEQIYPAVHPGDSLSYYIEYKNNTDLNVSPAIITDTIDSDLQYSSLSAVLNGTTNVPGQGITPSVNNRVLTFKIESIPPRGAGFITFNAKINENASGIISNQAFLNGQLKAAAVGDNVTASSNIVSLTITALPCATDTWTCGTWGVCTTAGSQSRVCTLTFDCPAIVDPSPATSQSCTPVSIVPVIPPVAPPIPPAPGATSEVPVVTPSVPEITVPTTETTPIAPEVTLPPGAGISEPVSEAEFGTTFDQLIDSALPILNSPELEKAVERVIVPTLLGLSAAVTIPAFVAGAFNVLPYLHLLFLEPLMVLFGKRRGKYGVVYNALTKMPVDLAVIRVYDSITKKLISTKITDKYGRFYILAKGGSYNLTVTRPGYIFPTAYLKNDHIDGKFFEIYHGGKIEVGNDGTPVTISVPMDPYQKVISQESLEIRRFLFEKFKGLIPGLGIILTIVGLIIYPTLLMFGFLALHVGLYLIFRRIVHRRPKSWGVVYDENSKKPVSSAVVRIFDARFNKLLETYVTDGSGRYNFLVGPNQYQVIGAKHGYNDYKTKGIDLTKANGDQSNIIRLGTEVDIPLKPEELE